MTTEVTQGAPGATAPGEVPAGEGAPNEQVSADPGLLIGEDTPNPDAPQVDSDLAGVVTYAPTGDVGLDLALEFVGKLGLGPDDPAMKAATEGKFDLLKGKLSGMGDKAKGWERMVTLAEKNFADGKAAADTKVAKDTAMVHDAVGGKENWAAISKWAGANADPAEKAQVNAALKAGGIGAKAMALWLQSKHAAAAGTTVEPANVTSAAAVGKPSTNGALTAKQYATEVQALRSKVGYNIDTHPSYQALQARRTAGMRSGI